MGSPVVTSPLDEVFAPYPVVLSVEQVAELIGAKSPGTAYELLQARKLPGRKVGGRWVVYKAELQRWLEAGGDEPPGP